MRQLTLLLFTLLIFGCSNDNNQLAQNSFTANAIKRISEKSYYLGNLKRETSFDFNYENGKLVNITDSNANRRGEFLYEGNKINSYKFYKNNILQSENIFTYSGNNLTEVVGGEGKTTFSYNNNKVVSKKEYYLNGVNYFLREQNDFSYSANNVESITSMTNYTGTPFYYKSGYDDDAKNTIFKNMNPQIEFLFEFESIRNFSLNNVTNSYSYESVDSSIKTLQNTYDILYNSSDFPISIKKYSATSAQLISELTIQYN
jgi:hypothetical protein